jgi:hypothetical protein
LPKLLKKYARYEGLIIDDLGYINETNMEATAGSSRSLPTVTKTAALS